MNDAWSAMETHFLASLITPMAIEDDEPSRLSMKDRLRSAIKMSQHDEHGQFTRAIDNGKTTGGDSAPGLIYADWLDERGHGKLAELYRDPRNPGHVTAGIDSDVHDRREWIRLGDAMHEAGKPGIGAMLHSLAKDGYESPRPQPFGSAYSGVRKQLWASHTVPGMMIWAKPVHLSANGLRLAMFPYGRGDLADEPRRPRPLANPGATTHWFVKTLSSTKPYMESGEHRPPDFPFFDIGGAFVDHAHAEKIMSEADHFHDDASRRVAEHYLGGPQEPERFSKRGGLRKALRKTSSGVARNRMMLLTENSGGSSCPN